MNVALADGLWAVVMPKWVAAFEVTDRRVVDCAPILRKRLAYWVTVARLVDDRPLASL